MEPILLAYGQHESKSSLTGRRYRLLWHCCRYSARRYTSPIPVHNLLRLCSSNVDRFNERKWLHTGKGKKQTIPAQTITDADYADDIALLVNIHAQAESLLHSLEKAASAISFHVNAYKIKYMIFYYNQRGNIFTLKGRSQKQVDKFTYLRSSVSSTENDISTRLPKAWSAIVRFSVIWKSDLSDKIKLNFFQTAVVSILLYGCTIWRLTKRIEKNLTAITQEC